MTGSLSINSTAATFAHRRDALVALRDRLDVANRELATGRKDDIYRALGPGAVDALRLRADAARTERQIENGTQLAARLSVTSQALGGAADALQDFLEIAVPNADGPTQTADAMRAAARRGYDALVNRMNASLGGTYLFAGVDTNGPALVSWDEASVQTGLSPRDVVSGIVAGGLTGAADAATKAAEVTASFADGNAGTPDRNFERSFYSGTPAEDGLGQPSERLGASIGPSLSLPYGIQANDPAFRSALQGLAMIASVDPATLDAGSYGEWVAAGIDAAAAGLEGIRDAQTRLGGHQATLDDTIERQEMRRDLFAGQSAALEGVDSYEAASRVTLLSSQLEASFASTARLMRLSFLDYM